MDLASGPRHLGYLWSLGIPNLRPTEETEAARKDQTSSDPSNPNYYPSDIRAYIPAFGSYQDNARQLANQINMVCVRYGVRNLNVVTHSFGGLDALYAVKSDNRVASRVRNIIMLAVPYDGTPLANWAELIRDLVLSGELDVAALTLNGPFASYGQYALFLANQALQFSPGVEQLLTPNPFRYFDLKDMPRVTHYATVAGDDWSSGKILPALLDRAIFVHPEVNPVLIPPVVPVFSPNDQAVPVDSVHATPADSLCEYNDNHFSINQDPAVSDCVSNLLGIPMGGISVAAGMDTLRLSSHPSTSQATASAMQALPPQFGPLRTGMVAPGTVITRTFSVASSSYLNTFLSWDQDVLHMTLLDSMGRAVTPLSASAQYTQTLNTAGGGGLSYELQAPSSGIWTAVITNTNAQGRTATFVLGTSFASSLTMTPAVAVPPYQPSITTPLSVTLADAGAPIAGATITATASLSGTTPVTTNLVDTGNGVYSGNFGALAMPGEYTVNLLATGTDKGAPFALTGLAFFTVATGNASFTGTYAEGATPGDFGLYSSLVITPTIQVNAAGTYSLHGTLADAAGDVVGTAGTTADLSPGTSQALGLSFDGNTIGATGKDGPYQLRDLTLTDDSSGSVLTDDEAPLAYTTAPYAATQFARPLIQILPGTQDVGTNPNAQGQFQNLTVSFTATGALNDSYQVAATLASAQGQYITAVTQSVRLSSSPTQVALQFSGADIAALGIDGPYYVTGVTIVPDSSPTTYVSYPSFWTTQAYSAASFAPPSMTPTGTPVPPTATPANTFAPPAATPTKGRGNSYASRSSPAT